MARSGLALLAGIIVLGVISGAGWIGSMSDALGAMGFDPDRTGLITALAVEAIVVAASVLSVGRSRGALLAGVGAFWALFLPTFAHETSAALSVPPAIGRFDIPGWAMTLGALIVVAALVAAAAALLVAAARATLINAGRHLKAALHRPVPMRRAGMGAAVVAVAALVVAVMPVFGDMVNFDPGVRMISAGAAPLAQPTPASLTNASPGVPGSPSPAPSLFTASPQPGSAAPLSTARPWLAWRPSGSGTLHSFTLPGPWTGGTSSTASGIVYTPPGYGTGNRRYPVIYEFPWGIGEFQKGANIVQQLDALIISGAIPPVVMVFASQAGGPFPDSECMNSADGRESFESYAAATLVQYIDSTYRTISRPEARSLLGFSQGGYCASMLLLRHPDVFSSAVVFSGYFQAALKDPQTPNAWRPYGSDQAIIAATSPINLVSRLSLESRNALFFALSAPPDNSFYGLQLTAFVEVLRANAVAHAVFPKPVAHSWTVVRDQLPTMLETLAARMAATQVFGP